MPTLDDQKLIHKQVLQESGEKLSGYFLERLQEKPIWQETCKKRKIRLARRKNASRAELSCKILLGINFGSSREAKTNI